MKIRLIKHIPVRVEKNMEKSIDKAIKNAPFTYENRSQWIREAIREKLNKKEG